MLVSALVGIENRATMDIDTTIKNLPLTVDDVTNILTEIIKIDISTGDVITPGEIQIEYKLMFEDRTISIYAYNIETVLAEKLETVISRGPANTRLRDFYDLYTLYKTYLER